MITNIIDRRKRPYRFLKVNAVVEATWQDNACEDADQVENAVGPVYEEEEHITVAEAIQWAHGFASLVTLYLYDEDGGIYPTDASGTTLV